MSKSTPPLKNIIVHMGMFDFSVRFLTGDWADAVRKCASIYGVRPEQVDDVDNDTRRGVCWHRPGYIPVIWVPAKPTTAREHATFAHECLHAVFHLFEWANMPIDRSTEETSAHAMAHLINAYLEKTK